MTPSDQKIYLYLVFYSKDVIGKGQGTYAWLAIAALAGIIIMGVYFVVPEYREDVLGISATPEKNEIILDVNRYIGHISFEKVTLRHDIPFSLKYIVEEELESSGSFKISSNIFKIGSVEITLKRGEYIIIKPIKISGKIIVSYNGNSEEILGERKYYGPAVLEIRNELSSFQFFGTSIINYTIYRVKEVPISIEKVITFEVPYSAKDAILKVTFSGNCPVKILANDRLVRNDSLTQSIRLGPVSEGILELKFIALKGADCKIESLSLELYPEDVEEFLEKTFGKISGERIKIILDILNKSEDLDYTVTFTGKRQYNFRNPANNTVEVDIEDITDTNIVRIVVNEGWMFIKRMVVVGE